MTKFAGESAAHARLWVRAGVGILALLAAGCTRNLAAEFSTPHYERAPTTTATPAPTAQPKDGSGQPPTDGPRHAFCPDARRCPQPPPPRCAGPLICPACPACQQCPQPPALPGCSDSNERRNAPFSVAHTIVTSAGAPAETLPWSAIAPALLTGLFGFIGLIIAKEAKVSEFRKEWIDGLRADLGDYVSALSLLAQIGQVPGTTQERLGEIFMQASSAQMKVRLRLDEHDAQQKILLDRIKAIQDAINNQPTKEVAKQLAKIFGTSLDHAASAASDLYIEARPVLQTEWRRIERWGTAYQFLLVVTALLGLVGVLFAAYSVYHAHPALVLAAVAIALVALLIAIYAAARRGP